MERDYNAKLVIFCLEQEVSGKAVAEWLRSLADSIEKKDNGISDTIFTAKLMKKS